jgi:ribosomal protein L36
MFLPEIKERDGEEMGMRGGGRGRERMEANWMQSVRRKGGKSGKGHVYIICSLNPKHKQRQGK